MAIEIERRFASKRTHHVIESERIMGNTATHLDGTLNSDGPECNASNYDTSAAIDSILDESSQTHRNVTLPITAQDIEYCMHSSLSDESHASDIHDDRKSTPKVVPLLLTIDSDFSSITPKNQSPSFSLHSSPSVDALNESRNLSLYFTPVSGRESFSPIPLHKSDLTPRLIRSNSYTLDKPSPMLIQHMKNNFIMNPIAADPSRKSPMVLNRLQSNQANTFACPPRKSMTNENVNGIGTNHKSRSTVAKASIGAARSSISMSSPNVSANSKNGSTKTIKSTKSSPNNCEPSNGLGVFKNSALVLRSVYGQKLMSKVQHSNKKNKSAPTTTDSANTGKSPQTHITHSMSSNHHSNKSNTQNNDRILAWFEQQRAELLKRQQEEQKRMQAEFLRQQNELLQKQMLIASKGTVAFTPNGSIDEATKKSNEKMLIDEANHELPIIVDSNGNRVNRFTPESGKCIRRLRYDEHKTNLSTSNNNNIDNGQLSPTKVSTDESDQFEMYTVEQVRAASVIVAHARGYLTRRLLQTKKVLDLRRMHHDTLELLLDISEEDTKNESKSDVEFKFNLLQQVRFTNTLTHCANAK